MNQVKPKISINNLKIIWLKVIDHDLRVIANEKVKYEVLDCNEPSHISPSDSIGYSLIDHTTRQVYPEVATVPG